MHPNDAPKQQKLKLSKETVANMKLQTGVRAGAASGEDCPRSFTCTLTTRSRLL
jgi:hypothetical protein